MAITRAQQVRQMLKEGSEKPVKQAGVMNFKPSEMVTVPKIAKSSPNTPTAKLAYITPEEQDILVDLDLYGSLNGTPNRGPGGIPSLEGDFFTDLSGSSGGSKMSSGEAKESRKKDDFTASRNRVAAATNIANMQKALGTKGSISKKQQEARQRLSDQRAGTIQSIKDQGPKNLINQIITAGGIVPSIFQGFSNSKIAKYNNMLQRNNFLRTLPVNKQVEILEALAEEEGIGTTNPMGIDRNIQRGMGTYDYLDPTKVDKGFLGTGVGAGTFITDINFGGKDAKDVINKVTDGGYDDYLKRFDKPDDRNEVITDPCKGPNPPPYCFIGAKADDTMEEQTKRNLGGLAPRFAGSIFNFDEFAADGGRIGAAEGGIMDLETGRQMYFLGKLVKKASRTLKKITKSPLGKAALLGGALYFGGAGGGGFSNLLKKGFLKDAAGKFTLENLSPLKTIGIISALSGLMAGKEEEEQEVDRGPKLTMEQLLAIRGNPFGTLAPNIAGSQFAFAADGGRIGYQEGSKEPVAKKTMPLLDMGGQEMDLRENGGFVPIGRMEKADDVPARLSKNEFVFTAEAVRNAGDGDVDKGSEVMYNMMKNLESGGEVSEESQGLDGARKMFQTSQRLEEVL